MASIQQADLVAAWEVVEAVAAVAG